MKIHDLAGRIGATILTQPPAETAIEHVYAGDRVSDLLSQAHDRALLVSNLNGSQLLRLAELMDAPAVCLLNGHMPDMEVITAAAEGGTAILVSPYGMFETCGRLFACIASSGGEA